MTQKKLFRIILPVIDIDKAEKFYAYILDQKGERVSPGRHYFNLGGTILACYDPEADGDDYGEGWKLHTNQYIYIATSDIENIFEKIRETECKRISEKIEKMPWGERLFYADDPFGNPICFVDDMTMFMGKQN